VKYLSGFLLILFFAVSCKDSEEIPHAKWTPWIVSDTAIFEGQVSLSGDPSVIHESGIYRMSYTGFDGYRIPQGPEICEATSIDGVHWTNITVSDSVNGRVLYTNSNSWSNAHETSYLFRLPDRYNLYFIGYQDSSGGVFNSATTGLGLATSTDAVHFAQARDTALFTNSYPDTLLDRNVISSPSITRYKDSLIMVYSGFCYQVCGDAVTASLLTAHSSDGVNWTKRTRAIINASEILWAKKGVAEAEIIKGPDNFYYLFMTSVDAPHVIGVARSLTPYGPWDINQDPIILANREFSNEGAEASSVLIEDGKVRLWYHGFSNNKMRMGYAESSWPLKK
jgi:hypothetical protein